MAIDELNKQITDVKSQVGENINSVLKRDDQIQKIQQSSENINKKADEFRVRAHRVREDFEADRKRKQMCCIGSIVAGVAVVAGIFYFSRK